MNNHVNIQSIHHVSYHHIRYNDIRSINNTLNIEYLNISYGMRHKYTRYEYLILNLTTYYFYNDYSHNDSIIYI